MNVPRLTVCTAIALGLVSLWWRATPDLEAALHDPRDEVREATILALGQSGPAAAWAVPDLVAQLDERRFRRLAAWALGEIGAPARESVAALAAAARDSKSFTRVAIAVALGKIAPRDATAAAALAEIARDENPFVRRIALDAAGLARDGG